MTAPVSVRKVDSKADYETFLRFPWDHYRDNPYWVPQLVSMVRHKLDKRKNPTWKHLEGEYFLAWRGDEPVGTVAAFVNHRHNEFHHEHVGFFGLFECIDDQEVATALLDTAAEHVRGMGYDAIRGPASFSTNDECGVLLNGYDAVPSVLTPYNYPYYPRLIENAPGFAKVMDLYGYHFTQEPFYTSKSLEQAIRVAHKNSARRKISVRTLDGRRVKEELNMLRRIYNAAWSDNWGFVPLSDEELDELVKDLGRYLEPRLTLFASVEDRPVAFLLAFPDLNQVLHRVQARPGKPEVLSLAQALWHWKIRPKITRIRVALLGVEEGYRGIGVEAAMFARLFEIFQELVHETNWRSADAGWVLETNEPMDRLVLALGGERYRQYRFYERALAPR